MDALTRIAHTFARSSHLRNGCGQAAVARVLESTGSHSPPLEEIYRAHPPDTPFALLGTSPRRVARACAAYGLEPQLHSGGAEKAARGWLEAQLAARRLCILLLDLRHLGRTLPGGHYVVADAADEAGVHVSNLVRTPLHAGPHAHVPWPRLMRAWRCRAAILPSWRYAAVACDPRSGQYGHRMFRMQPPISCRHRDGQSSTNRSSSGPAECRHSAWASTWPPATPAVARHNDDTISTVALETADVRIARLTR